MSGVAERTSTPARCLTGPLPASPRLAGPRCSRTRPPPSTPPRVSLLRERTPKPWSAPARAFTCRTLLTGTSNTTIRRCVPVGERREGESCDPDYISRIGAWYAPSPVGSRTPRAAPPGIPAWMTGTVRAVCRIARSSDVPRASGASASPGAAIGALRASRAPAVRPPGPRLLRPGLDVRHRLGGPLALGAQPVRPRASRAPSRRRRASRWRRPVDS